MTQLRVPRIGVGAVILNEKNEILLVLRNRAPEKGTWSIPGGKVDLYEMLEDTVVREIKEEVDLDIRVEGFLCTAETIKPDHEEHWISVIYRTSVVEGEARNMEEGGAIGEIRWFSLEELPENLACFTVPAIQAIHSSERTLSR
ncbi:NUDIX domain-containing protein [Brevibacillus ginsengisoli]|uniref:NUDIX domain-containing protein n=1 Tax=Brevibacillus ginsengisoli TaxID=363854 RepID=UPI003CE95E3B